MTFGVQPSMDLSSALLHRLKLPQAQGKRVLDYASEVIDDTDGLIWLARWRAYGLLEGLDLDAVDAVLQDPTLHKSLKNANAQASTVD